MATSQGDTSSTTSSGSTMTSTSMHSTMKQDQASDHHASSKAKQRHADMLPDTGETVSTTGMMGAFATMLTGLALLKKSKK
ncbi:LPXTG cell wall anchor domain-containing protein, partial [Staphylococcus delphini]